MASWRAALATYRQPRLIAILLMGFSSGLPLPLVAGTLSFWLAKSGVNRTTIGLFGLTGIAYVFKFAWSPLIDRLPIAGLTHRLGRRRSWALLIQALLAPAIIALGLTDPAVSPLTTAAAAVLVAFLSASQDIVIDAYRIELLRPEEQGAGAAATQWGYRFGTLASGAGVIYAGPAFGWNAAYFVMGALMLVGFITVCFTPEPAAPPLPVLRGDTAGARALDWLSTAVAAPLMDFFRRPQWFTILLFIVLYKYGDALAAAMANPLYVALQFTGGEVAGISKVFGVGATMIGVALGGVLVAWLGLYGSLLVCGVLQNVATLMYAALALAGHDLGMLTLSIAAENVTSGMGSAAFVAYLSRLCNRSFTATQYALFSALFAFSRIVLSAPSGWLADRLDWAPFFVLSALAGVPGLLVLLWLMRRGPAMEPAAAAAE